MSLLIDNTQCSNKKLESEIDKKCLTYSKQDLLMESLSVFFKNNDNIKEVLNIVDGKSSISLRILDWFVTNYSKKNNIKYSNKNSNQFIVYLEYKCQLKAYSKKQFDPFCRRNRINFYYDDENYVKTTVGQLNFFRWAIENDILDYVTNNLKDIEQDMNQSLRNNYKKKKSDSTKRRKRQSLSVSATKTINKHNVSIVVSFE